MEDGKVTSTYTTDMKACIGAAQGKCFADEGDHVSGCRHFRTAAIRALTDAEAEFDRRFEIIVQLTDDMTTEELTLVQEHLTDQINERLDDQEEEEA